MHWAVGIRYLTPKINQTDDTPQTYTNIQTNFFVNSGLKHDFKKGHGLFIDLYLGGIRFVNEFARHSTERIVLYPDYRISMGYAFTFGKTINETSQKS